MKKRITQYIEYIENRLECHLSHLREGISNIRRTETFCFSHRGRTYHFSAPAGDHIINVMKSTSTFYEQDLLDAVENLKLGGTYVDVGGYIGNHSLFFSTCCSARRLVTIEPHSLGFLYLVQNVARQATIPVEFLNCAISDQPGLASMQVNNPTNLGMTSMVTGSSVSVRTLDSLLTHLKDVTFIKIDVEGSELAVLKGARSVLEHCHPVLSIESSTETEFQQVKSILEPLGYAATERYCYTPTWLWNHRS